MTREKAELIRYYLLKAAELLADEDASEVAEFFPEWVVGFAYQVGDKVRYTAVCRLTLHRVIGIRILRQLFGLLKLTKG